MWKLKICSHIWSVRNGLGGKTIVPPIDLPTGSFAWFADIDGNVLGLWKPKK
jgi:predicted enzyme related to lactoylglutathione lyase